MIMKTFCVTLLACLVARKGVCVAFVGNIITASVPAKLFHMGKASTLFASASGDANGSSKLTSQDIINRARKMSGLPVEEEEEEVKIFDDELLNKMQRCLLILEKRVQRGPGSLAAGEVTELSEGLNSIITEMKNFQNESSPNDKNAAPSIESASSSSPRSIEASWGSGSSSSSQRIVTNAQDISNDEGPAYAGSGGMGLAKGTKNTYIIEGMDEMSPEEYRAALQKSVIDAQAERRKARRHVVGNKAAHDYLSTLGYGGTSESLSGGKKQDGQ